MKGRIGTETGDFLWTNMMVGEVFPSAITPSTWSVWQDYFSKLSLGDTPSIEIIAGRPYVNYSMMYSFLLKIARTDERAREMIKDSVGIPPAGVEIPTFPVSWGVVLFQVMPREFKNNLRKDRLKKKASGFLAMLKNRCHELGPQIKAAQVDELIPLWVNEIKPMWNESHYLQDKLNEDLNSLRQKLKTELIVLVGEDQANTLLTTISSAGELASLGPLAGLSRLRNGELSREEYFREYGHRGPNENELAEPRPCEDLHWLERQLSDFKQSPVDVADLLAKRDAEFSAVLANINRKLPPEKIQVLERQIDELMKTTTLREATRSELTRIVNVIRAWFLRAGEVCGLKDDVFFLTVDEVVQVLSGDESPVKHTPSRREIYQKYRDLPRLPAWIRGRFDPLQWAADPNRRLDVYDPHVQVPYAKSSINGVIKGHPGSAGHVEGIVQRIDNPNEGDQLHAGEILVTSTTNVGWTPLFPRAAAVITDIGGSLSHAAIVARELGIPAVVGCGNATMRLKSGDRVRVDGGRGTVEILEIRNTEDV